ncbi:MAG: hypothetical protein DRH11_11185 [Deltaproteobacteria bacterium]|nr:MAG: hypothetical protein DRH11_11185 [Deltaproteobacteria bacterium]
MLSPLHFENGLQFSGVMLMSMLSAPGRKAYIKEQKEKHGRHVLGVFPAQYPKEILWAMNILPVEIWDPPIEVSHANARLQPSICSVVRVGLELVLQGHCDMLDGFLFPHTCDSIQNAASIVNDYLGLKKPCYFFYHPKEPYKHSSRVFYRKMLERLVASLEEQVEPLDPTLLRERLEQAQRIHSLVRELYELRAKGKIKAGNEEFYRVIRMGEYFHPEDFFPLLEEFLNASRGKSGPGPTIILSGVLPNPPALLSLLDDLGVRIGDDDLLSCGRRVLVPQQNSADPFDQIIESYFSMAPCITRGSSIEKRLDHMIEKIERSGAPVELLRPFGFYTVYPENHGALCGAQKLGPELCAFAEERGYHQDLCSYARVDLGVFFSGKTPVGKLPRPDLLFASNNICQTVVYWYKVLAHELKIPLILFDTPFNFTKIVEADIAHMVSQLEEIIPVLEKVSGEKFREEKFRRVVKLAKEASLT